MKKLAVVGAVVLATAACVPVPPSEPRNESAVEAPREAPSPEPVVEETPEELEPVDVADFVGATTESGPFQVTVTEAYNETTVSDGWGFTETAPDGMEYSILRLEVTNTGSSPEWYENYGVSGTTHLGNTFNSDGDAEIAIYDVDSEFYSDELNPNSSGFTYSIFLLPEDETLVSVTLSAGGELVPAE
jgi:hypothetical protein